MPQIRKNPKPARDLQGVFFWLTSWNKPFQDRGVDASSSLVFKTRCHVLRKYILQSFRFNLAAQPQ